MFVGSQAPVAFVGVDGAVVRYNTFYQPGKWVLRILQETTEPGFAPCRNGRFERNLIVFRRASVQIQVNIGPHTSPETFAFADNLWYCEDRPQASRPDLPAAETGGLYGVDPQLTASEDGRLRPRNPQAAQFGIRHGREPGKKRLLADTASQTSHVPEKSIRPANLDELATPDDIWDVRRAKPGRTVHRQLPANS